MQIGTALFFGGDEAGAGGLAFGAGVITLGNRGGLDCLEVESLSTLSYRDWGFGFGTHLKKKKKCRNLFISLTSMS